MTAKKANELFQSVLNAYVEQSQGWKKRNLFERQWVSRDFKEDTGVSIDEMLTMLRNLSDGLRNHSSVGEYGEPLSRLSAYYEHQQNQLKGFEKDPKKLQENLAIRAGWIQEIRNLLLVLTPVKRGAAGSELTQVQNPSPAKSRDPSLRGFAEDERRSIPRGALIHKLALKRKRSDLQLMRPRLRPTFAFHSIQHELLA